MNAGRHGRELKAALTGRTFGPPLFDYLVIGGGLSLIVTALVRLHPAGGGLVAVEALPTFLLLSNAAHFAASTVRLYTKPGSYQALPFLTLGLPLSALVALSLCIALADRIGPHLQALYLTWSPYHYAAQAYGLAVLYAMRSGCRLTRLDQRLLWWVAMLPFFYNAVSAGGVGLHWLLPESALDGPAARAALGATRTALLVLALATPPLLFARIWRGPAGPPPLISLLAVVTNGVWFFVLPPLEAFVYATIFHGLQYLAIVIIFHVKDQLAREGNRHGPVHHALRFYGTCLLLGYALFNCLPLAYVLAGFGRIESVMLVVAAINIHHFIVDAFIWKLGRDAGNRRVVEAGVPAPA